MKKIIFIEPKSPAAHIFSLAAIPRLGTLLLGTILKQRGYEVRVYIEEISQLNYADIATADLVGISTITSTAPRAYQLADKIRAMDIPIVFGGAHVSFLPEEALAHGDYVVRGEGEHTLLELIDALEHGTSLNTIAGLSYHEGIGVVHNPPRPLLANLDENPIIDYSLIPGFKIKGKLITLATSRGCPFNCKFCSVIPMFGTKYRFNSVDHVIKEIKTYSSEVGHFFFADDNFTANKTRTKQLLRRLLDEKIKIEWSAQVRADAARDTELLDLMQQAGCFAVFIGFESINPKTLEAYNKRQTVDEIRKSIDAFHQRNIYIHGMFVLGSDYDTADTIRETTRFAKKLDIDSVQFMMLTPLPGTETYAELLAANRITNFDWSKYDAHHAVFEPKEMTSYELQTESYRAMRHFYTWRSILSRLLRLDFFYVGIKWYGKHSLKKAKKPQRAYRIQLKQKLLDNISWLKSYLPEPRKIKRVGLPANMVDGKYRQFLMTYFKKLGMKVIVAEEDPSSIIAQTISESKPVPDQVQESETQRQAFIESIQNQAQKLRDKVDVVILPYINDVSIRSGELWQQRVELTKQWLQGLQSTQKTAYLVVELRVESLAKSCSELGLLLNKRLRKSQKAYRYAAPFLPTS